MKKSKLEKMDKLLASLLNLIWEMDEDDRDVVKMEYPILWNYLVSLGAISDSEEEE